MEEELQRPIIQQCSIHESEQSHEILVPKHLIPPPLSLLPKWVDNKPRSLLPMIPLPNFIGIIPNFQPLQKPMQDMIEKQDIFYNWIGEAFQHIVYRKYDEVSYTKVDNVDENWNIWACDVNKLLYQYGTQQKQEPGQIKPFYQVKNFEDRTLVFESRFESGNLSLVSKLSDSEYNLLLQNDINTNGYSQWFFFKVSNTASKHKVKFNILNLCKHNSLYNGGMKIVLYSSKQSENKNLSWHRGGQNIKYFENGYSKSTTEYKPFFTLSWQYTFLYDNDEVYFAYSYPFTYSNLQSQIQKIEQDSFMRTICTRNLLCKTPAGNRIDVLTITQDHPFQEIDKDYIVITARIHPGETISSYVCNGILQFLLSPDQKARKLRHNFIFKVVPMLNPDGVIHGNYRANISGYDLNRKWQHPSKHHHSQIFHLKKMIFNLQQTGNVALFCDLHGHSMKKNAFIYGCHDSFNPKQGKIFPLLVSKLFKGFSFKDCSFLIKEQREGTSRSVLSKQLKHQDIYTLESSFCGPEYENIHFTVRHFEQLGQNFCQALLIYFKDRIKQMQIQAAMKQKSFFPNNDQSRQSNLDCQSMYDLDEITDDTFIQRVNSENSQGSEPQNQYRTILQQRIIKKYLFMKSQRPATSTHSRSMLFKRNFSRQGIKIIKKNSEFSVKSISPVKRKDLYQQPKVEKIKISNLFQKKIQRHNIEPKLFTPSQFIPSPQKKYRSTGRLPQHSNNKKQQSLQSLNSRLTLKLTLNKNYQFKALDEASDRPTIPIFKNSSLKNVKQDINAKKDKKSQFLIRKSNKFQYMDDRNSTNLFKSVLSSLRKEKN